MDAAYMCIIFLSIFINSCVLNKISQKGLGRANYPVEDCTCYSKSSALSCDCCDANQTMNCLCISNNSSQSIDCQRCQAMIQTCSATFERCSIVRNNICLQRQNIKLSYQNSTQHCAQIPFGKNLAKITPDLYSDIIKEEASWSGKIWMGSFLLDELWRWVLKDGDGVLENQGCFYFPSYIRGYQNISGTDVTLESCKQFCRSYSFANINVKRIFVIFYSITTCLCSNDFLPSKYYPAVTENPTIECQIDSCNNNSSKCTKNYSVYKLNGTLYSNFVDQEFRTNAFCIAYNINLKGWIKLNCDTKYKMGHICGHPKVPKSECDKKENSIVSQKRCYTVHMDNSSWYEANSKCAELNGSLAFINKLDIEKIVFGNIVNSYNAYYIRFWIALTNRMLVWEDLTPMFSYLSHIWGNNQPQFGSNNMNNCAALKIESKTQAQMVSCSELNHFYCEMRSPSCDSNPCSNGANCVEFSDYFVCQCDLDWTGKYCDVSLINEPYTFESSSESNYAYYYNEYYTDDTKAKESNISLIVVPIVSVAIIIILIISVIVGVLYKRSKNISKELEHLKRNMTPGNEKQGSENTGAIFKKQESPRSIYDEIQEDVYDEINIGQAPKSKYQDLKEERYVGFRDVTSGSGAYTPLNVVGNAMYKNQNQMSGNEVPPNVPPRKTEKDDNANNESTSVKGEQHVYLEMIVASCPEKQSDSEAVQVDDTYGKKDSTVL